MDYYTVKNWEKFQHYKDRSPPWIKLHRDLLRDYEFSCLQDASKLQLMLLWLLASQLDNKIPTDPEWITRQLGLSDKLNLKPLIDNGFICLVHDASKVLADCKQSAIEETEAEAYKPEEKEHTSNLRFDEWWKAYPKKIERKKALAIWKRRKLDSIANQIIEDTKNRPVLCAKWKAGFICNPTTYLNGDRWNDDYESPRTNGTGKDAVLTKHQERERRNREAIERANRGEGITPPYHHGGHVATHD